MFVANKKISQARMNICRQCKYYVKDTGTCGPIGLGKKIQYQGQKYKLCGCIMEVKTKLVVSACPVGFWGRQISETEYAKAKQWVKENHGKNRIPSKAVDELVELSNAVLGKRRQRTGCGPCLKAMADEMKRALDVGL